MVGNVVVLSNNVVFMIKDNFDVKNLKESVKLTEDDFEYFVCSKSKLQEFKDFFKEKDLIIEKCGDILLLGYEVKILEV